MRVRCGWKGCGAALVLVAVAGAGAISPTAPAGAAVNFSAVATADAARVSVIVPNAPATSSIVDTGITSSQAVVQSAGTSKAYASNPYPGENAVTIHGTLAGFGVAGVPAYPLYAESVYPSMPKAEIGNGPFHLLATSTATSSEGLATSGEGGDQANVLFTSAMTAVRQGDDGGVTSKAESKVQGFVAGPLKIASIVSSAETKVPASGGALEKASSLDVTGIMVNDVAVQLTPGGLKVRDQTVPVDGKSLEEALARAGLKVSYIAPQDMPNGIVGAGLRVSTQVTIPGNAPSDVVWVFGRALAVIDAAPGESLLPGVGEVGVTDPGTYTPPPAAEPPGGSSAESPPADVAASSGALSSDVGALPSRTAFASLPAASAPDLSSAGSAPSGELAAPAEPSPASAAESAAAPPPQAVARPAAVHKGDDSGVYLLLVAGAAAVFVLAQLLGALGVRGK